MEGKKRPAARLPGHHLGPGGLTITAYRPLAKSVRARLADGVVMDLGHVRDGVWSGTAPDVTSTTDYRLLVTWDDGVEHEQDDPYRFAPTLGEMDLHLFNEGRHERLWTVLGSHVRRYRARSARWRGLLRRLGAPGQGGPRHRRLQRLGPHLAPDAQPRPERRLGAVHPRAVPGMNYQFAIRGKKGHVVVHTDPMASAPRSRRSRRPSSTSRATSGTTRSGGPSGPQTTRTTGR